MTRFMMIGCAMMSAAAVLATGSSALGASATKPVPATPQPDPSGITLTLATHGAIHSQTKPSSGCTPVRKIEIKGVVLIDADALRAKLEPLAADCIGNDEVKAFLGAINEAYSNEGYVATQGYLPEQDLRRSKVLVINVIAGRIDHVVYKENRGDEALPLSERYAKAWGKVRDASGPWSLISGLSQLFDRLDDPLDDFQILPRDLTVNPKIWTSFITDSGDIVQIDAIQQGIDQINRVASSHSQVKLEPGQEPATSNVVVENNLDDSFRLYGGYELNGADINGSGNTIPSRFKLDAAKDNFIGINDAWRASYAGGVNSNEARGSVALPFRRFTFSVDGGYSESLSEVAPGVELFTRDGNVTTDLGYLLYRTHDHQINLDTSLAWREDERFLNGDALTPQTITYGRLGINETRTFETLQLTYGIGLDRGLPWLGAKEDLDDILPSAPRAEFLKIDGQASLSKSLTDIGMLRIDLNGQWTGHPLYSDDQLVLGSVTTVRGFTNSAVRTDRGGVLRTEFAPALPVDALMSERKDDWVFLYEALTGLQPYFFADYGIGRDLANHDDLQRAGVGAGLRYRHGRINLDVSMGEPVYRTGGIKAKDWQSPEAYLTLSVKLL